MSRQWEVYDNNGQGIDGKYFRTWMEAEEHAQDVAVVAEFGVCHPGKPCPNHDEWEEDDCMYCDASSRAYRHAERTTPTSQQVRLSELYDGTRFE